MLFVKLHVQICTHNTPSFAAKWVFAKSIFQRIKIIFKYVQNQDNFWYNIDLPIINMVALPKVGIKLTALDIFIASVGGRTAFVNFDVAKVRNKFMKPLTLNMKSSYCDFLKTQHPSAIGEAQVFIS